MKNASSSIKQDETIPLEKEAKMVTEGTAFVSEEEDSLIFVIQWHFLRGGGILKA